MLRRDPLMPFGFKVVNTVLLLLCSFHIHAVTVPVDFQYQGKPISPLCIAELSNGRPSDSNASNDSTDFSSNANSNANANKSDANAPASDKINLFQCTREESKYKLTPYKPAIEKGFIGFDYTLKNSKEKYVQTESAYYKYLGKFNNFHVIYLVYSGGGSGSFTSVFLVDRSGDNLEYMKTIIGIGDRCNGGINEVSLKDNKLIYSLNITPYDYIDISQVRFSDLKAYDDLAACAACCQGTANFESDFEKENFVSINIGEEIDQTQGVQQECFNKILKEKKLQGKQTLSPQELKEFVEQFKTTCLNKR